MVQRWFLAKDHLHNLDKYAKEYGIIYCPSSQGIIFKERAGGLNDSKMEIARLTNAENLQGDVCEALKKADVFIGVSAPNLLKAADISKMERDAIVFAMANPIPEIMPDEARAGGAKVVATGRSDFANQLNNVLVFPGIFRGVLDNNVKKITEKHKLAAAHAIANLIKTPKSGKIIPGALDKKVAQAVAGVFKK